MKRIGIIGLNARSTALSAKNAGYDVFLATYFSDVDTSSITKNFFALQKKKFYPNLKEYSINALVEFAIKKFKGNVENVILTSKVGDSANAVRKIEENFHIIGNNYKNVENAKDWNIIKEILDKHSILYPETKIVNVDEINEDINFPCVIKAMDIDKGRCLPRKINNSKEIKNLIKEKKIYGQILIQEFIDGIPLSCSILSDGKKCFSICVNRQLTGQDFNDKNLKYYGNIVPFDKKDVIEKIKKISEIIISELHLVGSNGIDYVLKNDKIYFMEVNPRIQDTIENIEKFLSINLVERHIKACDGELEEIKFNEKGKKFYGKAIVYAKKDGRIKNLDKLNFNIGDIPHNGSYVKENDPICCVYEEGKSNKDVMKKLKYDINLINHFALI